MIKNHLLHIFKSARGLISLASKKQMVVVTSSINVETKAIIRGIKETILLRILVQKIEEKEIELISIFCDSQCIIKIAKNPICHTRSKHVEV